MEPIITHTGVADAAEAVSGRHRPDHPGRVPEAGHQDQFEDALFPELRQDP